MKRLLAVLALGASAAAAQTQIVVESAPVALPPKEKPVTVVIETSEGNITAELYPDKAPVTVSNFLAYVDAKFYDATIFHRVIKGFMIQGGGFTSEMRQKPTRGPIKNEAGNGLKNDRGTLAMARLPDVDSATAQFFINHKDNEFLNHGVRDFGYAVFGKVTEGLDAVDKIATTPTNGPQGVPLHTVTIKSIRRAAAAGEKTAK